MSTNYSVLLSLQTWVDLVIYILQTRYDRSDCVAYKVRIQKVIMIFFPSTPVSIGSFTLKEPVVMGTM